MNIIDENVCDANHFDANACDHFFNQDPALTTLQIHLNHLFLFM